MITMGINVQSLGLNNRSTARIHRAGAAAIAGAIALALSLLGHDVGRIMGIDGNLDVPGTLANLLSYGSLTIAWGLLFVGSLGFAAVAMRADQRLLTGGSGFVSLALGLIAMGFGFATVVALVSPSTTIFVGDMLAGIGIVVLLPLASFVLGIALVRTEIVPRLTAWLMVATGPAVVAGVFIDAPLLGILVFAGPLCVVWVLIGRELIATSEPVTEPDAATA